MKRFISFLILICFSFVIASCDILKPVEEKPTDVIPAEEYELKVSRLLNNVKAKNNNELIDDDNIKQHLVSSAFKLYGILSNDVQENFCISPTSIYFALSLLYLVGDDIVKDEIKDVLGLTNDEIVCAGLIYKDLTREIKIDNKTIQPVYLSNSIWLDSTVSPRANEEVLNELAEKLYCYAYETYFSTNNVQANADIREFVKQQTNGLIDCDFDISPLALFVLINTLYFKDSWMDVGSLKVEQMKFALNSKESIEVESLVGNYFKGRAYIDKSGSAFSTKTNFGYYVHFLVPNEGYKISEVMNYEYFKKANEVIKEQNLTDKEIHYTRVIFPSFNVKSDLDCKDEFGNQGYLIHTFSNFYSDLLIDEPLFVSKIIHKTNLTVDKDGVVGAAVTVIEIRKNSSGEPIDVVYHDFLVNKEFGYVITSPDGIVLFMGQITNPNK